MDGNTTKPFLELDGDKLVVRLKGSSPKIKDIDVDYFYTVLLDEIIRVMSNHPHTAKFNYALCPRWQLKKRDRRDIHVRYNPGIHPFLQNVHHGTIRIETKPQDTSLDFEDFDEVHNVERNFRLSFHPEAGINFITAGEFYDMYNQFD